ncbi:MAG: AAA family ATPase, partial [Gemmatimonadetes bacterium]|nr:AAA family ATPase [Gemmatimonadota bacterium]
MAGNDPLLGQVFGGFQLEARLDNEVELVYAARGDGELVEIVLSARPETDASDLERCAKAAEAATRVAHPNVAAVIGSGYERGFQWLATQSAGESRLSQRLESGKITVDEAVPVIMQVVAALRAVHSADLLHGNLRPQHIGIDAQGHVKVTGLGRPSSTSSPMLTRVDEIVGNAEHMAPEQILGGTIGPATDLYSVGLILYQMITGSVPFASTAPATLVYHQLNVSPEPPSLHDAAVPAALDQLIEQLLAKIPEQRLNSATQALAALEAISRRHQLLRVSHIHQTDGELSTQAAGRHQRFEPQFLGRDTEIAQVQELARSVADGHGRAVFIAGEAGIGKTRLLTEFSESLQTGDRYVAQGSCFFGAPLGPYVPIFDAISQLLSHDQGLIAADRESVADTFVETAPGLATLIRQSPSSDDLRTTVAQMFGDDDGGSAEQTRFLDILFDILHAAAMCRPLIVVLEDLHWSDTGTQQFLRHLSHRLSEAPILLIATYRPEDRSRETDAHMSGVLEAWRDSDCTRIDLPRLSQASTAHLTRSLFFDTEFRAGFDEYVYRQSQGNPFIAMEVLKLLRSRHLLLNRNGIWQAEPDFDRAEIPARVEALVREGLDGLSSAERQLLQLAAAIGSRFSSALLEKASGLPRVELLGLLFQLEKIHRLVIAVDGDYEFSHSMIREVLYGELPGELRREYHRLLAGLIADRDWVGEAHTDLGHHLFISEQFADALPHLVKAADEAAHIFSWDEAAAINDDVFAAGRAQSDVETQITALLKSGRAYGHLAHYEAATERFQQCRQMAAD